MVSVFRAVRNVLRPDGVLFLNIGDKSAGSGGAHKTGGKNPGISKSEVRSGVGTGYDFGVPALNLVGIPWRLALAMQADGWLLRSAITWVKNATPESLDSPRWEQHKIKVGNGGKSIASKNQGNVDSGLSGAMINALWKACPGCDQCKANNGLVLRWGSWRPTESSEMIFMFTKTDHYYCDGDGVSTPMEETQRVVNRLKAREDFSESYDIRGANLRDTWFINAKPVKSAKGERHFATFPSELARRCIESGSSAKGVCGACSAPYARIIETIDPNERLGESYHDHVDDDVRGNRGVPSSQGAPIKRTIGWRPTCEHNEGPIPATVCDPFSGSGTSMLVARLLGRHGIGIDISEEYHKQAVRRISTEGRTIN